MKVILVVLCVLVAVCASQDNWFRIANHIGTSLPAAIKFKSCGLVDNVFVNAKDSGRFGFGYDVPSDSNGGSSSMCSNGCDDKKRTVVKDDEERGDDNNALYAQDSAVNFMIYWTANSDGTFSTADKIFTRITNGDVAYSLGEDTTLTVSNVDQLSQYATVGSSVVRRYPSASFQFFSDNHVVTQNWYFEQINPDYNCQVSEDAYNDVVTTFTAGSDGTDYKTRVTFVFTENCDTSIADGVVSVSVIDDGHGNLVQHIQTLNGAESFGAPWITDIQVLVTDASDSNTIYINSSTASGLPGSTTQLCNHKTLTPAALKREPLVSSS